MTPDHLEGAAAEEILSWVATTFGDRAGLSCSFGGAGGIVLAHMIYREGYPIPLLFVDTDFLFPETYALKETIEKQWGLTVRTARSSLTPRQQEEIHGPALWSRDPDLCCRLRKVLPMKELLQDVDCWVTGLRRDQSQTRARVATVELHTLEDGRVIHKVNPLAAWTRQQVWAYVARHSLPYNPLLDAGYSSLGCTHCTAPSSGPDERAGRWRQHSKTECGLHTFTQNVGP